MSLSVSARAEIAAVAEEIERFGLRRNAERLRIALSAGLGETEDERPFPVQDRERMRTRGHVRAIPWGLAELLYPAYGHDQDIETLAKRGGFDRGELGMLAVDDYSSGRLDRMPLLDLYDLAKRGADC